jgi:hypothetical protein
MGLEDTLEIAPLHCAVSEAGKGEGEERGRHRRRGESSSYLEVLFCSPVEGSSFKGLVKFFFCSLVV